MMYEGKHIHFSPVDNRPLCSYSGKLCRQRRVNNYAFCIRHILEDKAAPFKQCAHVAKYNNQKCTNPIPSNENREFCNSHMQVAGMAPKKERKNKKEKEHIGPSVGAGVFAVAPTITAGDGKLKFAERVKLLKSEELSPAQDANDEDDDDDPYTFSDATPPSSATTITTTAVAATFTNTTTTAATKDNTVRHFPSGVTAAMPPSTNCNKNSFSCKSPFNNRSTFNSKPILNKPVLSTKPYLNSKPIANSKPFFNNKSTLNSKPVLNSKPTFNSRPHLNSKPVINNKPTMDNNSIFNKTSVNSKSAATTITNSKTAFNNKPLFGNKIACNNHHSRTGLNHDTAPAFTIKVEPSSRSNCVSVDSSKGVNCGSGGGGSGGTGQAKSSKSVNRLEARIARNKILDKLKKSRTSLVGATGSACARLDFSSAEPPDNPRVSETISSVVRASAELQSASPLPSPPAGGGKITSRPGSPWTCGGGQRTLPAALADAPSIGATVVTQIVEGSGVTDCAQPLRTSVSFYPSRGVKERRWRRPDGLSGAVKLVQRLWEDKVTLRTDLFPLGLDGSDTDSEGSDVEIYQRHWFASPSDQDSWGDAKNGVLLRSIKQNFAKSDFRRQCAQMRQSQNNQATTRSSVSSLAKALVDASRCQPLCTGRLLDVVSPKSHAQDPKKLPKNAALSKQKCCYSNEVSNCPAIALPYTRHCIKHIMYNVDQLLFEHCTAKFADNTQCCIPVFDVCHELPLCVEHARKRDNYSKMSAEPKPKKPRKKTKPSALTRPPKRGKKKKRQNMKLADVTNLSHESSTSQDLLPSTHFNTSASSISHNTSVLHSDDVVSELDGDLGSDLVSQLSPGTIDKSLELPMDAAELANQASRLLEEHDFTEVLSKIPDEAFTELFNESKNGDLCHSREADELARALAAVDKDAKFSHEDQMELHEALLHGDHLNAAMDHTLSDLVSSAGGLGLDSLHVITSSLSTSDLNSITGLLNSMSSMTGAEGTLAHLPLLSDLVSSAGHNHNHNNHHHHDMMAAGGFSLRHDGSGGGSSTVDQFVSSMSVGNDQSDSLAAAQWFNDYSAVHAPLQHNHHHHNGFTNSSPSSSPAMSSCGSAATSLSVTTNHQSSSPVTATTSSKYVSHSMSGISGKLDAGSVTSSAKGFLHNPYGSLGGGGGGGAAASFLDNAHLNLGPMAPLMMELTENPAESVS